MEPYFHVSQEPQRDSMNKMVNYMEFGEEEEGYKIIGQI